MLPATNELTVIGLFRVIAVCRLPEMWFPVMKFGLAMTVSAPCNAVA